MRISGFKVVKYGKLFVHRKSLPFKLCRMVIGNHALQDQEKKKETRKKILLLACTHILTLTLPVFMEEGEPFLAQNDAILFTVLRREGCLESGNCLVSAFCI